MPKQKERYEAMLEEAKQALKQSPEAFKEWVETSEEVIKAASDMTKDELELINQYLKRDMKEFGREADKQDYPLSSSPFYQTIVNTIWQSLADITDKTQLEWREVFTDLEHQGVYNVGEMVGLGVLVCEKCQHQEIYHHPQYVAPCSKCGHNQFTRKAFEP
ncbi:zinc ribbon-containing protein [Thaumasiovibrio sp. DFM-14]|uniref:zinc ribbon-containing protein n=1 Tax=Thaumasiovibrio sp. DFM-14 TaxID=3384792 RepID=UPI0039A18EEA